ncbi:MAG TPA: RES family NAD+ phosphorylase [Anaerolineales bacterium]|nr:RES family NAD+ phosphorylase [Anaerolineales bacterium]
MFRAWRIVKTKYLGGAFSGEGAARTGGRWNSVGTRMVYTASSASLALLEVLVNLGSDAPLRGYSLIELAIDEVLINEVTPSELPRDWRRIPPPMPAQILGDTWVREMRSAVLAVPSAVVPHEHNYLLNPQHADFPRIRIGDPSSFPIDERLARVK